MFEGPTVSLVAWTWLVTGLVGEEKVYIATQGPIVSTVGDFWRMVWQEHRPSLSLITNIEEMNRGRPLWTSPGVCCLVRAQASYFRVNLSAILGGLVCLPCCLAQGRKCEDEEVKSVTQSHTNSQRQSLELASPPSVLRILNTLLRCRPACQG